MINVIELPFTNYIKIKCN